MITYPRWKRVSPHHALKIKRTRGRISATSRALTACQEFGAWISTQEMAPTILSIEPLFIEVRLRYSWVGTYRICYWGFCSSVRTFCFQSFIFWFRKLGNVLDRLVGKLTAEPSRPACKSVYYLFLNTNEKYWLRFRCNCAGNFKPNRAGDRSS